ncbi:MAG TPA: phosphotransferase family protein [Caulobacteraceae bacterium]|nr:phosphotransferase family protein [Caulobacteraceae bacterium]
MPQHALDEPRLFAYLADHLDGFSEPAELRQFQGGQSNPTYLIDTPNRRFVLRKKPPGKLLPSAHMVEREYRVMDALRHSGVPVPNVRLLCEDAAIAGAAFYVMDHVDGRVFTDTALKDEPKPSRKPIYALLARTLAALHRVDPNAVGLGDFGKTENYVGRQIDRWSRQYDAAKTEDIPAMVALTAWLPQHAPKHDEVSIVHGDFRLGNMIYASDGEDIKAVLDWELSTLGHPLSDLAYAALPFRLPPGGPMPGLLGVDCAAQGLPTEQEFLETYAKAVGRDDIPDFTFFLALSLFRLAGIAQGVYARSLAGNAADRSASRLGEVAKGAAMLGWSIAQAG